MHSKILPMLRAVVSYLQCIIEDRLAMSASGEAIASIYTLVPCDGMERGPPARNISFAVEEKFVACCPIRC